MNAHLMVLGILIFAISAHESIAGMVENVEETIVKWQAGTENCGKNNLVGRHVNA